ncbi:cytochrome c oxidase subunit II [Halapricum salinum]|uniref:Cytochrome C oxidase subunit II n=1 Tax=Halapricum salinum TaxID=1457250 RepID=A0A4D6HC58_9EURY|nr:cytochrome c oxidase subunit II [Halapricum salinum]QCC51664.1 cytochrome C oxidase subunit II [Halapricum salinum]
MHIHDYEKLWLGLSLVMIVGFIATVTYGAVGAGVEMIDDSGDTVDPNSLADHPEFGDPGVEQVGPNEYDVHVIARQFVFQPDPIVVPANSTVTFYVTSADVTHGFEVVGTNANAMVIPGEVAELTVEVNEPNEYGIICHEYCGSGHHDMEGLLRVVPEDEYDGGDR